MFEIKYLPVCNRLLQLWDVSWKLHSNYTKQKSTIHSQTVKRRESNHITAENNQLRKEYCERRQEQGDYKIDN